MPVPESGTVTVNVRTPSASEITTEALWRPDSVGLNPTAPPHVSPGSRGSPPSASAQSLSVRRPNQKSSASRPVGALTPRIQSTAFVSLEIQNVFLADCDPTATLPKLIDLGVALTDPIEFFAASAPV